MRVRVLEECRTYWNYGMHKLNVGDVVKGGLAEYLAATGGPVEVLDAPEVSSTQLEDPESPGGGEPGGSSGGVPDGTADEVLTWVGDDPKKAATAIEVEELRDKPRSTLIGKLEKIVEG